jgi:hypothetical protein
MTTCTTEQVIYAKVRIGKYIQDAKRVIKQQLFVVVNDVKHHLIGNIYYDMATGDIVEIMLEQDIHTTKETKKHLVSKFSKS